MSIVFYKRSFIILPIMVALFACLAQDSYGSSSKAIMRKKGPGQESKNIRY